MIPADARHGLFWVVSMADIRLALDIDGQRFRAAEKGLFALAENIGVSFAGLGQDAQRVMVEILNGVVDAMELRHGSAFGKGKSRPSGSGLPRGARTGVLQRRSGRMLRELRRSIEVRRVSGDIEVTGSITLDPITAIHETGGVIKPRRAKYLAIPFDSALKSDGTPIRPGPRDWPNTFVLKSRKGNLIIMQKKAGKLIPLYLLKKQVAIPPRLGVGVTLNAAGSVFVDRLFDRLTQRVARNRRLRSG